MNQSNNIEAERIAVIEKILFWITTKFVYITCDEFNTFIFPINILHLFGVCQKQEMSDTRFVVGKQKNYCSYLPILAQLKQEHNIQIQHSGMARHLFEFGLED